MASKQESGEFQKYNHKGVNSANNHMSLEEDPRIQREIQPNEHLDCSLMRAQAENPVKSFLDS